MSFDKDIEIYGIMPEYGMDGSGTKKDPYVINDIYQLQSVNAKPDCFYIIKSDIDGDNIDKFKPIGRFSEFSGAIYGNGFEIKNISIYDEHNSGLFATINGGSVSSLTISNLNVSGLSNVGCIAGKLESGSISNIKIENTDIFGVKNTNLIVGENTNGEINEVKSKESDVQYI